MTTRLSALLRQCCPVCLEGAIFRSLLDMYDICPVCGIRFEREDGYYLNAMFIAYVLGFLLLAPTAVILYWFDVSPFFFLAVITVEMALFWPLIYRYARVLWLHIDQLIAPRQQ